MEFEKEWNENLTTELGVFLSNYNLSCILWRRTKQNHWFPSSDKQYTIIHFIFTIPSKTCYCHPVYVSKYLWYTKNIKHSVAAQKLLVNGISKYLHLLQFRKKCWYHVNKIKTNFLKIENKFIL